MRGLFDRPATRRGSVWHVVALAATIAAMLALGFSSASAAVNVSTWSGAPMFSVTSIATTNPFGGTSIERQSGDNKYIFTVKNEKALGEGETLVCQTGEWTGTPTSFSYQWLRNGVAIAGATSGAYKLVSADKGDAIQCQVAGTNASADSAVLALKPVVIAPVPATEPPVATAGPALSGTEEEGKELTCPTGTWSGSPTFARQWLRNGAEIAGATGEKYTLAAADMGTVVQCQVTGTNAGGSAVLDSSTKVIKTAPVTTPTSPPASIPALAGVAPNAGERLSCGEGSWTESPTGYTYQWLRNGAAISGATAKEYVLAAADEGTAIQCKVTATNAAPDPVTAVTTTLSVAPVHATAPPALATAPVLSGTSEEGKELTCATGVWGGTPTLTRQWLRNGVAISGATGETYKLGGVAGTSGEDNGKAIQCQVTAVNAGGTAVAFTARDVVKTEPASPKVPALSTEPKVGVPATRVTDVLAPGERLGYVTLNQMQASGGGPWTCVAATVTCSTSTPLAPGESVTFTFKVRAGASTPNPANGEITVSGGNAAAPASLGYSTTITPYVGFGFESFWAVVQDELGTPFTQSTGHPFSATTQFAFNTTTNEEGSLVTAGGDAKNIEVQLPPGFVGSPGLAPTCSMQLFEETECPEDTAVGYEVPTFTAKIEGTKHVPTFTPALGAQVYNLPPPVGTPAAFGFKVVGESFTLVASVRSETDYGVTITSIDTPPNPEIVGEEFTFCANGASKAGLGFACNAVSAGSSPFIDNPAKCTGTAPRTTVRMNAWEHPNETVQSSVYTGKGLVEASPPSASESFVTGCEDLKFEPTIEPKPLSTQADSPTGVSVFLNVPQQTKAEVLRGSNLTCVQGTWTGATGYAYQWLRNGVEIPGATNQAYTTVAADEGQSLQCLVKASTSGDASATLGTLAKLNDGIWEPVTPPPVPATALPAPPTAGIAAPTGTATAGNTLTCVPGTWTGSTTFTYSWLKNGVPIVGATSSTYVLQAGEVPSVLQCEVTATNAGGLISAVSANKLTTPAPTPTAPALSVPARVSLRPPPNTPEVKDATVTFPQGLTLSPSAAQGLEGCTDAQFAVHSLAESTCPDGSKIGTVKITTPLLTFPLEGQLFLGTPQCGEPTPCTSEDAQDGKMFRLFIQAIDPENGVVVKVLGTTSVDPSTGQVTASFDETPQLPFEVLELKLKNGPRAPLATPQTCGVKTTHTELVPWSTGGLGGVSGSEEIKGTPNATSEESFTVDWDGKGGACPATLPFGPAFTAGTSSTAAGITGSDTLSVDLSRGDREQDLGGVTVQTPEGLLGMVSEVKLCAEPQAQAGTCGPESQIGKVTAGAGPGTNPYYVSGAVYLTTSYRGAPFGLSIVVPTKAGPFNLGDVVVRATVNVDPHDAHLTIASDPLPQILDGIPLRLRTVNVEVDKPGFIVNPSSCAQKQLTATITGAAPRENQDEPVKTSTGTSPYEVGGCASLPFNPSFAASTQGKTSKADGASLTTSLTEPSEPQGTQTNIAKVKVELPKQLPSRLTTLQKACTNTQFEANPAGCPAESKIGSATVNTPLLPVPLSGPAIFVSHGGEAFPSLTLVLQGDNVTIDLVGTTYISKAGVTSTTFKTVPDAPFSTFKLTLPEGPYSALTTAGDLCTSKMTMPTEFVAQNGAELHETTPVTVTGCKPSIVVKSHKVKNGIATIKVSVPSAGKLVARGNGLSKASKKASKASTVTIKLKLSKKEQAFLKKHKGRKLKSKVKLVFTPTKGAKLKAGVTVLVR